MNGLLRRQQLSVRSLLLKAGRLLVRARPGRVVVLLAVLVGRRVARRVVGGSDGAAPAARVAPCRLLLLRGRGELVGRDGREAVGVALVQLPRVLLQVEVPAESLVADLAGERLLLVVRVHMERQVVDLVEGLVADVALVRLLAGVSQPVVLVVALLVEPLAAVLAGERLVALVDAHVRV